MRGPLTRDALGWELAAGVRVSNLCALAFLGGLPLTGASACGGESAPPARATQSVEADPAPRTRHPSTARLRNLVGGVRVGGAVGRERMELAVGQALEVADGGRVAVDLPYGFRVTLYGPTRGQLGTAGTTVFLIRGQAHALAPPAGNTRRPPLLLATPSVSAELGGAGESFAATFDDGTSWLSALQGPVRLSNGDVDSRGRLRTLALPPGRAVVTTGRMGEPTEGPRALGAALEAVAAFEASEPASKAALRAAVQRSATRLDASLRRLETETRRGRDLTERHRAAVRAGAPQAAALQRELVDHARALYERRRLAETRWDRLHAKALLAVELGAGPALRAVESRIDRVRGLLSR